MDADALEEKIRLHKEFQADNSKGSRADFTDMSLEGGRLKHADLKGAKMVRTNLQGADLRDLSIEGTDATGSNLKYAHISILSLIGVNLTGVDITGLNLTDEHILDEYRESSVPPISELSREDLIFSYLEANNV